MASDTRNLIKAQITKKGKPTCGRAIHGYTIRKLSRWNPPVRTEAWSK